MEAQADEQAWGEQIERGINAADAGDFASDNEVNILFQRFENSVVILAIRHNVQEWRT